MAGASPDYFVRLLRDALDAGITLFDTANIYTQGESETLIGQAFAGRRHEAFLCTKVGYLGSPSRRLAGRLKPVLRPVVRRLGIRRALVPRQLSGTVAHDFSRASMKTSLHGSLKRLQTDAVDLVLLHSPSADDLANGEAIGNLLDMRQAGLARLVGVSLDECVDAKLLQGIDALQIPVNAFVKDDIVPYIRELSDAGIGVIGRQCLASGRLTRPPVDSDAGEELTAITRISAAAKERGITMPEAAFRDVHSLAGVSTTLLGMSRPEHLQAALQWILDKGQL